MVVLVLLGIEFQSTRPRGARRVDDYSDYVDDDVSIHAPTWGATRQNNRQVTRRVTFQSTRPRGARHFAQQRVEGVAQVSIHAPTWGATIAKLERLLFYDVSIHAPTWGATTKYIGRFSSLPVFQSTRPRGARPLYSVQICPGCLGFNPRAHVGRDWEQAHGPIPKGMFQSTRPRGARQRCAGIAAECACFNPRAHVGRDSMPQGCRSQGLFQSTRPRGARLYEPVCDIYQA